LAVVVRQKENSDPFELISYSHRAQDRPNESTVFPLHRGPGSALGLFIDGFELRSLTHVITGNLACCMLQGMTVALIKKANSWQEFTDLLAVSLAHGYTLNLQKHA
jgi:hypothetical protein